MGTLDDTYTKALLHFNGSDGSTTFTDESGKTWTGSGTAQIDTAQKKFGTASLLLDGNSDYLSAADSTDWYWGTGSGTLDCWVRFNAVPGTGAYFTIFSQYLDSDNYLMFRFGDTSGTQYIGVAARVAATGIILVTKSLSSNLSTGTWYHLAWVKNGDDWMLFVNGTQVSTTATDTDAMPNIGAGALIGMMTSSSYFNGWIDELRWTKGVARWTANFTPPVTEYGGGKQFGYIITGA